MQGYKMEIKFSADFHKQYGKANEKIKIAFQKRLELFQQNPHNLLLKNHPLTGKLKGFRSINITGDWRAIFTEKSNSITFELLGTHSQLYKK